MGTATEIIDLSWVEFSDKEDRACDTSVKECSRQALWKAWVGGCEEHRVGVKHYCQVHLDLQLALDRRERICGRAVGAPASCRNTFWIDRWEPLR